MERSLKKIFVITGIIPIQEIKLKKDENDIILLNGEKLSEEYPDVLFSYGFVFPKIFWPFNLFSSKWNSYYKLGKKEFSYSKNEKIWLIPILLFPKSKFINNLFSWLNFILYSKKYNRIIEKIAPDFLHGHSVKSDGILCYQIFKKYGIPYILTIREFYDKNINPKVLEYASKIVTINLIDRNKLLNKLGLPSIFIPHSVDDKFFNQNKEPKDKTILKLISVCRLIPLKNLDKILIALSQVKFRFEYEIYGDGSEKENLNRLIEKYNLADKVRLMGFINNDALTLVYKKFDLFVMPSYPEALGRVYFEAMAAGLPVLASKDTGVDGIIKENVHGFLVDPNNIDQIREVLVFSNEHRDELEKMGDSANILANDFKSDKLLTQSYELYN